MGTIDTKNEQMVSAVLTTTDAPTLGDLRELIDACGEMPDAAVPVFSIKGAAYQPDRISITFQWPVPPNVEEQVSQDPDQPS